MQKRAYRYRFYPTDEQVKNLAQTFGCTRFVYNWALNKRKRAYFEAGVKLYTKDLSAAITALKKEEGTIWLKEVSSVPLQQALRHLDVAYTNFFEGRADYPTFKNRHGEDVKATNMVHYVQRFSKLHIVSISVYWRYLWDDISSGGCYRRCSYWLCCL